MAEPGLEGLSVLVTRPAQQAESFCRLLEAEGAEAMRYPAIEIKASPLTPSLQQKISRLESYDVIIFVSANAVNASFTLIRPMKEFPSGPMRVAIGAATARALEKAGCPAQVIPAGDHMNSEDLLAMPEMQQVRGKKVLIIRGGEGRSLLLDRLQTRGAAVECADVYQRTLPAHPLPLAPFLGRAKLVAVTSNEGLENLFRLASEEEQKLLRRIPLLAGSSRVLEFAQRLGYVCKPIIANNPGDDAMLTAVRRWWQAGETTNVRK
jgi:uroporphyrinogen-III synthase